MHGSFFWYELMTTDPKAAGSFYGDVVGWTSQDSGAPGMDYTLLHVGDRGVAGLMALPQEACAAGARPCWVGYVAVDDVDSAAAKIRREGGKVLREPFDVPGIIRFAVVADPQGAAFVVAKGLVDGAPPPLPRGTPGTVGWHELHADDWKSAFAFYESLFGWTKDVAIDMGPMGTYQLFATGGEPVGGMMNRPEGVPVANWGYYFNVAALDAAVARVKTRKGQVLYGPAEVPGGSWIVNAFDPQGAAFSLVAPKR